MRFQMIHTNEWNLPRKRQRLGSLHGHQQRPDQPRPASYRQRRDVIQRDLRLRQRLIEDRNQVLDVMPRCDLGNDPTNSRMNRRLRSHHIGSNQQAMVGMTVLVLRFDDRAGCLIARRFQRQDSTQRTR